MKTSLEKDELNYIRSFSPHLATAMNMSGGSGSNKGSYELYDDPRTSGSRPSPNLGQAPGCPSSFSESAQQNEELYRQLTDVKGQRDNLLQIIAELRQGQMGSPGSMPLMNLDGASGSLSGENVGENVKDGHIKHLQRQVTVLQANLYKAEGLRNKAAEASKDRDKAIDECRMTVGQLAKATEENESLRQELNKLNSSYLELQQKLRLTMQELDVESRHERCQSQAAKLQEEVTALRSQVQALKESTARLSMENKTLKDAATSVSSSPSGQSSLSSNAACSQELEYLHRVVDMLKATVLEQRNFLVNMKVPQQPLNGQLPRHGVNGFRDDSSPAGLQLTKDQISGMSKSASAVLESELQKLTLPMGQVHADLGRRRSGESSVVVSGGGKLRPSGDPRDVLQNHNLQALCSNIDQPGTGEQRQQPGLNEMALRDGRVTSPRLPGQSGVATHLGRISGGSGAVPNSTASSVSQNLNVNGTVDPLHKQSAVRKTSQSEILKRLPSLEQGLNLNQGGSKSDIVRRNQNALLADGRTLPEWVYSSTSGHGVSQSSASGGGGPAQFPTATGRCVPTGAGLANHSTLQNIVYEGAMMPLDQKDDLTGARLDANSELLAMGQERTGGGVPRPGRSEEQPIYRPPVLYSDNATGSVRLVNYDLMGGSRVTAGPGTSGAAEPRPPHAAVTSGQSGQTWGNPYGRSSPLGQTGSRGNLTQSAMGPSYESEVDPPRANLNSDRLCPVCNRDYSDVSMEDFQTHVFECFDDENGPSTMRPQESLDRTCPMCNKKFSQDMEQQDFEAHVHSHFGEEHFEVLH